MASGVAGGTRSTYSKRRGDLIVVDVVGNVLNDLVDGSNLVVLGTLASESHGGRESPDAESGSGESREGGSSGRAGGSGRLGSAEECGDSAAGDAATEECRPRKSAGNLNHDEGRRGENGRERWEFGRWVKKEDS